MKSRRIQIIILLLCLLTASGCIPLSTGPAEAPPPIRAQKIAPPSLDRVNPVDFPREIKRLEIVVASPTAPPQEKTAAQGRLARLYLLPTNPLQDEDKGLAALQNYVKVLPEGEEKLENLLWVKLLQEKILLEKTVKEQDEKNRRDSAELAREKQQLLSQVQDLTSTNAKLKKDIDQLKMIDLSVEKKRKSYR